MADPTPSVGLPEFEYIEIYNRSGHILNLSGWTLFIGTSNKTFENCYLLPYHYKLLCHDNALEVLSEYGDCYGFSSFSLLNNGFNVVIKNPQGKYICGFYFDPLLHEMNCRDGGYSLETNDTIHPAVWEKAWYSSHASVGGTPGTSNSIGQRDAPLPSPPVLGVEDNENLHLRFSYVPDTIELFFKGNYGINHNKPVEEIMSTGHLHYMEIRIATGFAIEENLLYTLDLSSIHPLGSPHMASMSSSMPFALPLPAMAGDVVINEIMANPPEGCPEYLELFNASSKVIDLSKLTLGLYPLPTLGLTDTSFVVCSPESQLFMPGDFLVLSDDPTKLCLYYPCPYITPTNRQCQVNLPALNNAGFGGLLWGEENLIDSILYSESFHYPLLPTFKGVSLERIDPSFSGILGNSWASASTYSGSATPGYSNSQYITPIEKRSDLLRVEPGYFIPGKGGYEGLVNIYFHFPGPGFSVCLEVFNQEGDKVCDLLNNQILPTEGFLAWDGVDYRGAVIESGIYIVLLRAFNMEGAIIKVKKAFVCIR